MEKIQEFKQQTNSNLDISHSNGCWQEITCKPLFSNSHFLFEYGITGMVRDRNMMPLPNRAFLPGMCRGGVTVFVLFPSTLFGIVCHCPHAIMGFLPAADCEAFINFHRFSCISNSDYCQAQTYFLPEIKVRVKTEPMHSFFSSKQQKHKEAEIRDVMANQPFIA